MKGRRLISILCMAAAVMVLSGCSGNSGTAPGAEAGSMAEETTKTKEQETEPLAGEESSGTKAGSGNEVFELTSLEYVKAMGHGWNLGNSFDGVNTDEAEEDKKETAWGNPVVTRELIRDVKDKGFDSIRIPLTLFRRYDKETYEIDEQ